MSTPGNVNLSMTRENAKIYIARVIGGAKNPDGIAMADEALYRAFNEWQNEKDWEFLLKDTTGTSTVTGVTVNSGNFTINAPTSGDFDGVNIGITITGTNIPASTTVSSYSRNADGTVASIVISAAPTGTGSVTLTFGGTIPIIAGTRDYNLPIDFYRHYGLRFTSNLKWPLTFIRPRDWNRVTLDQSTQGSPSLYTIFNPNSISTQKKGTYRLRIYPTPSQVDISLLEFYRKFDAAADPLDMDGTMLYKFLDHCRFLLITAKRAFDNPELLMDSIKGSLDKAKAKDEDVGEEEEVRMKSQMEMGHQTPLWTNGAFWPSMADYGY